MYEKLTDLARKVFQHANNDAKDRNHEYIGTEHILMGLVKEPNGACVILKKIKIDINEIRSKVNELVENGIEMVTIGKVPHTPRAKKVIEYSMKEASDLNHNFLGTEHILLGLLRETEGIAAHVLKSVGVFASAVRSYMDTNPELNPEPIPSNEDKPIRVEILWNDSGTKRIAEEIKASHDFDMVKNLKNAYLNGVRDTLVDLSSKINSLTSEIDDMYKAPTVT